MDKKLLRRWNEAIARRQGSLVITDIESGEQRFFGINEDWQNDPLANEIAKRLKTGRSGMVTTEEGQRFFLNITVPPIRLVIIGAVHISQALAPMARIAGLDVLIIDPRTAFSSPERFPDFPLIADWPQDIEKQMALDRFTALVAVTHDPKIDDFPLMKALQNDCLYVGALGSRKTHAKRELRLSDAGVPTDQLPRIQAPIGLNIGAASPAEIAVAILAQIIQSLRAPEVGQSEPLNSKSLQSGVEA
ncbi:MAG: XdhC family protein [Stappiaceae bacterium]